MCFLSLFTFSCLPTFSLSPLFSAILLPFLLLPVCPLCLFLCQPGFPTPPRPGFAARSCADLDKGWGKRVQTLPFTPTSSPSSRPTLRGRLDQGNFSLMASQSECQSFWQHLHRGVLPGHMSLVEGLFTLRGSELWLVVMPLCPWPLVTHSAVLCPLHPAPGLSCFPRHWKPQAIPPHLG